MYFVVGEIMRAQIDDFAGKGFVELDSTMIWTLRGTFVVLAVVNLVLIRTMFGDEAMLRRALAKREDVDDAAVVGVLVTAGILRLAFIEAIAIYGLVLYEMNAERYDLYGFGIVALIALISLRPSRTTWEETLRRMAIEHPGVSSSFS